MNYDYTYKRIKTGFNLRIETKWLLSNGYSNKHIEALTVLVKTKSKDLSDENISKQLKWSVRTYKDIKADLQLSGLIQVKRLNASVILTLIGSNPIGENQSMFSSKIYSRTINYALECIGRPFVTKDEILEVIKSEPKLRLDLPIHPLGRPNDLLEEGYDVFQHNKQVILSLDKVHADLIDLHNPMPENIL